MAPGDEVDRRQAVYLRQYGSAGAVALAIARGGGDYQWDPVQTANGSSIDDDGGVIELDMINGEWCDAWHIDGFQIERGLVYHVCNRGNDEHGWSRMVIAVADPGFDTMHQWCQNDEMRWQSWRPYYQQVVSSGRDPLGMFEAVVRRAARDALSELDRPLIPAPRS